MIPALSIKGLSKSYGSTLAVQDLSLTIEQGEIFGLLGPNGAGKSTTINMVVGVTRIDGGSVEIFGFDNRKDYRNTRRMTGVMHQEIVIDHFFTIDKSLHIHSGYYGVPDDPSWRLLLIDRLGLGPHLHKPMNKLSGGLKRRLMVAKALIHKPRLLILDEPTAGVDVELRHTLWEFVREINKEGTTVLLTTHYLEEAEQMCGRIAIMNHGRLLALARKEDLLGRMSSRTVTLRLERPLSAVPPEFSTLTARLEDEGSVLVLSLPSTASDGDFLAILCRTGLAVREIQTEKTRLEDVFLDITGLRSNQLREEV